MPASSPTLRYPTSWGPIVIHLAAGRVVECRLPAVPAAPPPLTFGRPTYTGPASERGLAARAARFVRATLEGRPTRRPPIRMPAATPFLTAAWSAMAGLPRGRVISYADLAAAAGRPRAVRAAGQACARNELPLFIPCHRVVAAGGRLGGFTGGIAWKELLLRVEGVR